MNPVDSFDWKGCSRACVMRAYMTKMYYFWCGRNAWNWSWSSRYPSIKAFHLALSDAKKEIEERRVQGSTWTIREVPAIALSSDRITLVIAEINADNPFEKYIDSLEESIILKTINEQLAPKSRNSIVRFTTETAPQPAELPFTRFSSRSYGGGYSLGWVQSNDTVNFQHTYELIQKVSQLVQKKAQTKVSSLQGLLPKQTKNHIPLRLINNMLCIFA